MGAGKSAVAAALGERMGASVADLDAMIEAAEGCTVAELFSRAGEPAFRERELQVLEQSIHAQVGVIACGGGVVLDERCRALLVSACRVVWLQVSPAEAARRIGTGAAAAARPLLAGGEPLARLEELLRVRGPVYETIANVHVATDGRDTAAIAEDVMAQVRSLA
jgi:shikimate kinase